MGRLERSSTVLEDKEQAVNAQALLDLYADIIHHERISWRVHSYGVCRFQKLRYLKAC